MTVPVPSQLEYISDGDGVTTSFSYPVRFLEKSEVVVVLRDADDVDTLQTLNTDYTIAGSSWPSGGNVVFSVAPASGVKVVRYRMTQAKQVVDLENKAKNNAESVEQQLDRLAMVDQDNGLGIDELFLRTVKFSRGYTGKTAIEAPEANRSVVWNADGTALVNGPSAAEIGNAEGFAEAAEAARDLSLQYRDEAEEFRDEAADYASFAKNEYVTVFSGLSDGLTTDYGPLSINPGSKNSMLVSIGGSLQDITAYELVFISTNPWIRFGEIPPEFAQLTVRAANAVSANTPSAGSVTRPTIASKAVGTSEIDDDAVTQTQLADNSVGTPQLQDDCVTQNEIADSAVGNAQLADNAVTQAKMADGSVGTAELIDANVTTAKIADSAVTLAKMAVVATLTLFGRIAAGSGAPSALTPAQLRDNFFPAGSVIDSVRGTYAANADLTAGIPVDDTIPQITEGTEIISVVLTPKSATNKFRIRFCGQGTLGTTSGPSSIVAAAFAGPTGSVPVNARGAVLNLIHTSNYTAELVFECEYTPGALTAQTISVRVGPTDTSGYTMRMNGNPTTRRFGGASVASLVVEEIKG